MKRLNNLKWFAFGVIFCLIVSAAIVPAFASSASKTAQLIYDNIKITLNGNAVTPKDSDGHAVEPFIIDGTTYLPVRAVASALGLGVDWDGSTNTVKLTDGKAVQAGTVLYEKNGIKITYLGISEIAYGGEEINLFIENSSSKNYTVQTRDESVNDIMVDPVFSCSVAAGKSAYDSITFYESTLEENHISSVSSFECTFLVFNDDNWDDDFSSGVITISR